MTSIEFNPNCFVAPPDASRAIERRFLDYFPENALVADLGCGDGVFLDLLRSSGRTGIGVDILAQCIRRCRERGLDAVRRDVRLYLRSHREGFDGVAAIHLLEHFDGRQALELVRLMLDALKPGGVLFLMTPSYRDFLVNSERFWLDISHVRPYPLPLLEAIFDQLHITIVDSGYDRLTRLHPRMTHPRSFFHWIVGKIRYGRDYDVGDTFIVGKKNGAVR